MTGLAPLLKPDKGQNATALHLVDKKGFEAWLKAQPARIRHSLAAQGFKGEGYQLAILPGERDEWAAAARRRQCRRAEPLVPGQGGREPARGKLSRRRARPRPGGSGLAARPVPFRPLQEGAGRAPVRACC